MVYMWTLDSHELLGPFGNDEAAHCYAMENRYSSYMLMPPHSVEDYMLDSWRIVGEEWQAPLG